ncbi:MAG: hypothetical protein RL748_2049, partial [Pseudomonadota bacterium]
MVLSRPYGRLPAAPGAFAVRPDGLAVLSADGSSLHLLLEKNRVWQWQRVPHQAGVPAKAQALLVRGNDVWVHNERSKTWQLALSRPATPVVPDKAVVVQPQQQTALMPRLGDAADDPAIWVHPQDARLSRVLGTNKKQGLISYDMQGQQVQLLEVGRLNNVDLRQRVKFGAEDGRSVDLAVASNRDDNSVMLFDIAADGKISEVARFATGLDKIYGICSGQPKEGG